MNQKFKIVTVSSSRAGSSPPRPTHFSRHSAVVAAKAIDHAWRQKQNRSIVRDQVNFAIIQLIAFC